MSQQRLQKVLAAAGVASRRKCEELIVEGAVCVNRRVVNALPAFVDPEKDEITVSGRKIRATAARLYFLLHKPTGVICTNSDPQGRTKAIDLIPIKERIFCAGRLDIETSGLIILTNDTELANRLTHPRYELAKTYIAVVKGEIDGAATEKLQKGVWLAEGRTERASVKILKRAHNESLIEITIHQSLNRQIQRMLAKVGVSVKSLKRTKIGKIDIRGLGVGRFRTLTREETAYLKKVTSAPADN